jgi:hypothetical protein
MNKQELQNPADKYPKPPYKLRGGTGQDKSPLSGRPASDDQAINVVKVGSRYPLAG